MSAMLPTESKSPSRRALLAGAIGGLGAWAASAIGRANPVRAEGEAIVVGGEYFDATSVTRIANVTTTAPVFLANGDAGGTGIRGTSTSSIGVEGISSSGSGVRGHTGSAVGVHGSSAANIDVGTGDRAGVLGEGNHAGSGTQTVGVWGRSTNNVGVYGTSQSSYGVSGTSGSAAGVFGGSGSGVGVRGASGSGVGVRGSSDSVQGIIGQGAIGVEGTSNNQFAWGVGGNNTAPGGIGVWGQAIGGQGRGVSGHSAAGHGIHGQSNTGWAGYFEGKVFTDRFVELAEIATPSTAAANRARLFVRDNGAGKTQLCVRFHTGAVKVLATAT